MYALNIFSGGFGTGLPLLYNAIGIQEQRGAAANAANARGTSDSSRRREGRQ